MGYPNLEREEAGEMTRKSEQKLLLACMLFVFACVILSGGWRLVGGQPQADLIPARNYVQIRAVLSPAPAQPSQSVSLVRRENGMQRMPVAPTPVNRTLYHSIASDSNGNVIAAGTYMRAVYQAFTLDDGFV